MILEKNRIKIIEQSLEWIIKGYARATDKNEYDLFVQEYFTVILEKPDLIKTYTQKYDVYKGE